MRVLLFICAAFLLGLVAGCSDRGTDPGGPPPAGVYEYTGYDSTGTAIVRGWLVLSLREKQRVDGDWRLEKIGEPGKIGPQIGKGRLEGGLSNETMWLDLRPQYRDNNIDLFGTFDMNEFRGRWHWITLSGISSQGTFVAFRK